MTAWRTPIEFQPGKTDPDPSLPHLAFADFFDHRVVTVPTHATARDWLTLQSIYPMFGNDQYGDCVFAEQAHTVIAARAYTGQAPLLFTDDDVLGQYSAVTGFHKDDPSTDRGASMQRSMAYWRKYGFAGKDRSLKLFAKVDHRNLDEVAAAIDLFGSVAVGCQITRTAEDQFNNHQPWELTSDRTTLGGHDIQVGWYDLAKGRKKAVTWGDIQELSDDWWDTFVDECWVRLLDIDWFKDGKTPAGLDLYGAGEAFQQLTGEPNPFQPGPPVPAPPPVSGPDIITPADAAVWHELQDWLRARHIGSNEEAVRRILVWARKKGLGIEVQGGSGKYV